MKWRISKSAGARAYRASGRDRIYVISKGHGRMPWLLRIYSKNLAIEGLELLGELVERPDRHDTLALAKATAEAYDLEPEAGTQGRLSRAIGKAYAA